MPSLAGQGSVLVTGASGFIASWIVKYLLEKGYSVRGTVRTAAKGNYLASLFGSPAFSYVIIPDFEVDAAFDTAVKGMDAVIHVASPCGAFAPGTDPKEVLGPAIDGTKGILTSILKNGPNVKRVVITSSAAAAFEPHTPPYTYTEADWNYSSVEEVKTKGADAASNHKYNASKALAERAAWEFVEQNKGAIGFELTTTLPTFVFGPVIHQVNSYDQLNYSSKLLYDGILNTWPVDRMGHNFVDVRDVATVHVAALENDKLAGERLVISKDVFTWQGLYDVLNASDDPLPNIPKGSPGQPGVVLPFVFSAKKVEQLLEIQLRGLKETAEDSIKSMRERGW